MAFHWLKGHNGHPENERCDKLAVAAGAGAVAAGKTLPVDEGYELNELNAAVEGNLVDFD